MSLSVACGYCVSGAPLRSDEFLVTLAALAFWPMTNFESQSTLLLIVKGGVRDESYLSKEEEEKG